MALSQEELEKLHQEYIKALDNVRDLLADKNTVDPSVIEKAYEKRNKLESTFVQEAIKIIKERKEKDKLS